MSNAIGQLLFWNLVPSFGSSFLLNQVYLPLLHRGPRPAKGEPTYARMRQMAYAFTVVLCIIYSLISTERSLPPNVYNVMNVDVGARMSTKQLRQNYFAFSLQLHPDKATSAEEEEKFHVVRNAYEKLRDSTMRPIYDKFGESAPEECKTCKTEREYIHYALNEASGYYMISVGITLLFDFLNVMRYGRYWRLTSLLAVAAIELALLTFETDPIWMIFHWRTPAEKIHILREMCVLSSIAIAQVGPVLFSSNDRPIEQLVAELEHLVQWQSKQASNSLADGFAPFKEDPQAAATLYEKMLAIASSVTAANAAPKPTPQPQDKLKEDSQDEKTDEPDAQEPPQDQKQEFSQDSEASDANSSE